MDALSGFAIAGPSGPAALFNSITAHLPSWWFWLAEIDKEVDVLYQMQQTWNNFVESGQIWALFIGFILGYLIRSLTAY